MPAKQLKLPMDKPKKDVVPDPSFTREWREQTGVGGEKKSSLAKEAAEVAGLEKEALIGKVLLGLGGLGLASALKSGVIPEMVEAYGKKKGQAERLSRGVKRGMARRAAERAAAETVTGVGKSKKIREAGEEAAQNVDTSAVPTFKPLGAALRAGKRRFFEGLGEQAKSLVSDVKRGYEGS